MRRRSAHAFTLVEMMIVIAIIGLLVMLLLPAVQAIREAARRGQCTNHLAQLMMAVQNYEAAHRAYPPGTVNPTGPIVNLPNGYHHSWLIQILPYLQEKNAYRLIDDQVSVYHRNNTAVRGYEMSILSCPSSAWGAAAMNVGATDYAGVHHDVEAPIDVDNNGVFFLNSRVRYDDVVDGQRHTLFIGEKLGEAGDLGWVSGTRTTLRNTGSAINLLKGTIRRTADPYTLTEDEQLLDQFELLQELIEGGAPEPDTAEYSAALRVGGPATMVGGFSSDHPGGANFAFGDGHVEFVSQSIGAVEYRRMGHRADGELQPVREQ